MTVEIIKEFKRTRDLIQDAVRKNSYFTEIEKASIERELTDLEINQMEDEQVLTDHDIAIMELQAREV